MVALDSSCAARAAARTALIVFSSPSTLVNHHSQLKTQSILRGAWPRTRAWVFPASAARWRDPGLRRRGCGAARRRGARGFGGDSDDSSLNPSPLPLGDGTPARKASLRMGSGLAPLLGAPLMSLLLMYESSRLVFRSFARVTSGSNPMFPLGLIAEISQYCSS